MKKVIILPLLLALAITSFSQQVVQKKSLTQTNYLQKSKKQKKIAWILLGSGAALAITAAVIPSKLTDEGVPGVIWDDQYSNDWSLLILPGTVGMLSSIPFFIASSKNKKRARAASVFVNMEKAPVLRQATIMNRSFPALGIRISL